jgi:8-oxo-dGTP pyrophosphatase MutT (NUDIX family)
VTIRPDMTDCWILRGAPDRREILLIRRAADDPILPGLWQGVSGALEPGERVALGAMRELAEETGFGPPDIEAFYDLDLVNQFHEAAFDAIVVAAVFAVRVRADAEPVLSAEHDASRWVPLDAVTDELVWPGYHDAIERIRSCLGDPVRASWFELTLEGRRAPR